MLTGRYWRAPFGSVRANYPDGSGIPEVQITNPSGGILGGDRLEMDVALAPGSAATILTQAANKVYRGAEARQSATFRIGEGSFLEYLPHHLIPFARSSYRQETEIHLAVDATLVAWDAVSAGRVVRGERFAFDGLSARMRIFRENLPEVVDGFELCGGGEPFGGYSYGGTAYVLAPRDLEPLAEKLHGAVSETPRVLASASALAPRLCAVRILARDAAALYRALNAFRTVARAYLDLPPAAREIS
ncbi:MAG: urease accessory protein UreD [Actinobacteria bacterium]|nr:urease accessory protein UreD [Actinomycetota bacterium]